jgi:cytidylate kinase
VSEPIVVAIDGPSGSGKSTVARAIAKDLGWSYLDTGSMYRAMTWYLQDLGIPLNSVAEVVAAAPGAEIRPSTDPLIPGVHVGDTDVSDPIRGAEVTSAVSAVSAIPEIRAQLVELQRSIASQARSGIVLEGRDIGSVVMPKAQLKLFITADPQARAQRRAAEIDAEVSQIQESIFQRDQADSTRATSPLEIAPDAILIDTTDMQLAEVIDHVMQLIGDIDG